MPLFLFLIKFQRTFTAQKKYRITSILSKAPTRFELVIEVLQTFALPLGYRAILLNDSDGNRTRVTAVKGRCLNRLTTEPYLSSPCWTRTNDTAVNSRMLYRLS